MERRHQWQFVMTDAGLWAWIRSRPDGTEERSKETFATLRDCTLDANVHGYVAWKTEEERRRELALEVTKALSRGTTSEQ